MAGAIGRAQGPDGTPATLTGELMVLVADDFRSGRSEVMHFVRDQRSGRTFRIRYEGDTPNRRNGSVVTVRGRASGSELYVLATATESSTGSTSVSTAPISAEAISGDRKVAVIVANFRDQPLTCSVESVQRSMFTDPNGISVAGLYRDNSHNALTVSGDVMGAFTIDASVTEPCDMAGWAQKADAMAAASGKDLSSYQHKMYVMPNNSCPASGYGSVGGSPGTSWVFACDIQGVFTHELGHNFKLDHAATSTSEYGDWTDPMAMSTWQMRGLNAPHREQLGWMPSNAVQRLTQSGTFTIAPLALDPAAATAPQILKIYRPQTRDFYYLSYRLAQGFDRYIAGSYIGRVSIHSYAGDGSVARTTLENGLLDGESFVDAAVGVTVTMLGHTSTQATVRVAFNSSCVAAPVGLVLSPNQQTGRAGSPLVYNLTVSSNDPPACPPASLALSGSVVNGWTVTAQPESVTVSPGGSATATVTVTSPVSAYPINYLAWVTATDTMSAVHNASASATYTVGAVCTRNAPDTAVAPFSQSGVAGATVTYSLTLTNRDSADCPPTTFSVQPALPTGWSGAASTPSITLSSAASQTVTMSVTSAADSVPGTFTVPLQVSDAASSAHSLQIPVSYTVFSVPPPPPPAPSGLSATLKSKAKQIQLAWTENGTVAGFRVMRNGVAVGTSISTAWTDTTWQAGATYSYVVVAMDFSGRDSAPSNAAAVTIPGGGGKKR